MRKTQLSRLRRQARQEFQDSLYWQRTLRLLTKLQREKSQILSLRNPNLPEEAADMLRAQGAIRILDEILAPDFLDTVDNND